MMQPRAPSEMQQPPQASMMESTRRKRKRPEPVQTAKAPAETKRSDSGSETEDHATSDAHGDDASSDQAVCASSSTARVLVKIEPTTAAPSSSSTRGPFRGKCLYQSRKCENERALKRNGKPHNLCDEHRDKQNQHQRKFDAKKYTRGKRTTSGSDGDDDQGDDSDSKDDHPVFKTDLSSEPRKALPSGKRRASVPADKPKRSKVSPATSTGSASLHPSEISAGYAAANYQQQHRHPHHHHDGASHYYRPTLSADSRPLEIRRPPALDVLRASPSSGFTLPHARVPLLGMDRRSPPYGNLDRVTISGPPSTPIDGSRPFPSPHGVTGAYPFLGPPQPSRSRSFDSGVTRISPMGGAAPGSMGQLPFDAPRQFLDGHLTTRSLPPQNGRADKLPSLQQLPLGQLTRSTSSHHSPYAHHQHQPQPQSSFSLGHSPYDRHSPSHQHFAFPRPPPSTVGPLLPSLRGQSLPLSRSSSQSPQHQRSYAPQGRDHDQPPY